MVTTEPKIEDIEQMGFVCAESKCEKGWIIAGILAPKIYELMQLNIVELQEMHLKIMKGEL